ncbi:YbhN family protein [candidate division KSB1 bacterium]
MENPFTIISGRFKKIIQLSYVLLVAAALIYFFIKAYSDLEGKTFTVEYIRLGASFLFYGCSFIPMIIGWYVITKKAGVDLTKKKTWRYWVYSQMGKYIPGKIWMVTSRAYMYKKENVLVRDISYLFILENLMAVTSAGLFGVISLVLIKSSGSVIWLLTALLMIVLGFVFIKTDIIHFILSKLLKILKKGELREFNIPNKDLLGIFFIYLLQWMFIISGFYLFVTALSQIGLHQFFYTSAAITLAASLGFIVLFAPAGLGVREGILVLILGQVVTTSTAIVISVAFRIFVTIVELFVLLLTKVFTREVGSKI